MMMIGFIVFYVSILQVHSDGQYSAESITIDWMNNDAMSTNFTMTSLTMKPRSYFAFAFSTDTLMVG